MIRVFIADDHEVVRRGLRQVFEAEGMAVVGEAADGRELLLAAETGVWDVLVLDLSLPRVSGHEVLRRLQITNPRLATVVLSMYSEEQYAVRLLREGAAAYLSKDRPADELVLAVRKAARGGTYVTDEIAYRMLREPGRDKLPHETLTAREYQVFSLILQGRSVTEIAAELDLTAGTVSGHLNHVKQKLSSRSIADIVSYAHRSGLVD